MNPTNQPSLVKKIEDRLFLLDTMMSGRPGYTSVFLVKGERAAILDSGVSVTAETVLEGVTAAGVDLAYVALTHAHYDHAGGAHELLRLLRERGNDQVKIACSKKPQVYLGRQDICDKLMKSGKATEGALAGEMLPIDEADFVVIEDGDTLDLGGATIKAIDAPGHANGHLVFFAPEHKFLFAGDACGMLARDPDGAAVIVPTAFAPEYNHEVYLETLKKIAAMDLDLLGFGHFGAIDDPAPALQAAAQKAEWLHGLVLELINETKTRDQVLDLLEADFGPALISVYDNPQRMRVAFKSLISGARQSLERKLN